MDDLYNAVGALRGLRVYNFATSTSRYVLGGRNGRWYSPRQKARCHSGFISGRTRGGPAPCDDLSHMCGINMYNEVDELYTLYLHNDPNELVVRGFGGFIGLTLGWGRCVQHAAGYRVQQALVVEACLLLPAFKPGIVHKTPAAWEQLVLAYSSRIRRQYSHVAGWKNVPMREFTTWHKMAAYMDNWLDQEQLEVVHG